MVITIDTDKIKDSDISIDELLYVTSLYLGYAINSDTFKSLNNRGLIVTESFKEGFPYNVSPTKESNELVEHTFADMEIRDTVDRFTILADKLRELYPTGRKAGTQLQWRDSTKIISQRLKAFVKRFGDKYSDESIIQATKKYIENFNGNYMYMQVLKYFIMKSSVEDGMSTTNSQLLSYLDNAGQEEDLSGDWTSTLK